MKSVPPTVLVTGGGGFIGAWVVRGLLERRVRVVVLDAGQASPGWERVVGADARRGVCWVRGSLLDRELLSRVWSEEQITHVIHLAALLTPACQEDPWEGCRVNVLGSVALFEEARRSAGRIEGFSYASSVAVFGDEPQPGQPGPQENRPLTFYGAFKKAVEWVAEQYWRHYQLGSVGIRPQVVYGPERAVGLTAGPSLAARAAAVGESFTINYTGRIGYDYVEDVARAFVRGALETPGGAHVVDLPSQDASPEEMIEAIEAVVPGARARLGVAGPPLPARAPPLPQLIARLFSDWQVTPLEEGLRKTVDFYRARVSDP